MPGGVSRDRSLRSKEAGVVELGVCRGEVSPLGASG